MSDKFIYFSIFPLLVLKIMAVYFTDFSLYGDEAQYWLWSQSPDFGYFSKPPLLSWFLSLHSNIFGDSFFSLKMFPLIVYFFISFGVYKISLCLSLSKNNSALCALSFLIIPAASISSFLISTDLLLLLFWSLAIVKILEIRVINSTLNFFLLGLFLGLAFLAKYAGAYFFISLFFLIIIDKKTFSAFRNNRLGFVVFLLSFFFILLPNIYWNLNNGWVTFVHTTDNANLQNLSFNFYGPIKFIGEQILMLGPILVLFFFFLFKGFYLDFENKFLLIFSIPIIFIVLIESFLVRANANWAAPALISIFILLFRLISKKNIKMIKINYIFNYCIVVVLFVFILISSDFKIFHRIAGVNNFTNEISAIIKNKDLIVSDRIIYSSIAYSMREKSNNLYMPYKTNSPITNHFQMTSPLKKSQRNNFYLLGELGDITYLSEIFQSKLIKEFDVSFSSSKLKLYEVIFK